MMDLQTLFNVAVGIAGPVIGWFTKTLWDAVRELQRDLTALRVAIPSSYVAKDDFTKFQEALFKKLDRIEEKIDGKADK